MNRLSKLLKQPLGEVKTSIVVAFLVIALVGFFDSGFLTIEHYRGVVPPCTTAGCDLVLTSAYSQIFGIPTSLLGTIYYFIMVVGSFMYIESRHGRGEIAAHHSSILKWTLMATVLGFIMSVWFTYLQVFVIHSYCLYCLGSAVTSTLLFAMAIDIIRKNENIQYTNNQ